MPEVAGTSTAGPTLATIEPKQQQQQQPEEQSDDEQQTPEGVNTLSLVDITEMQVTYTFIIFGFAHWNFF